MNKEPVTIGGAIVLLVNSVLALGVLLSAWTLDADQLAGFNLVLVNLVVVITLIVTRSKVQPVNQ